MPINGTLPVPSTAATTARLGLMNPVDSDLFKSSDFAATAQILDAVPGTYPVANLAALQALTWTSAQHGTRVLQLDNGAEWYWYQPSGAGVWKRTNSVGLIAYNNTSTAVSTTSFNPVTFNTVPTFTAPGVRALRVDVRIGADNTSNLAGGIVIITLYDNNTQILEYNVRCGQRINNNGTQNVNEGFILNPTPGSTHQIQAKFRCANLSTSVGGGGTSVIRQSSITITEV